MQVDYTNCWKDGKNLTTCREQLEIHLHNGSGKNNDDNMNSMTNSDGDTHNNPCPLLKGLFECTCYEPITLDVDFPAHVFVYYGLSNFYQNHRRYVKSRSDKQLLGNPTYVTDDCAPFDKVGGAPVAPCGAIANSLFNDSIRLESKDSKGQWR